jgi:hypothetical protein
MGCAAKCVFLFLVSFSPREGEHLQVLWRKELAQLPRHQGCSPALHVCVCVCVCLRVCVCVRDFSSHISHYDTIPACAHILPLRAGSAQKRNRKRSPEPRTARRWRSKEIRNGEGVDEEGGGAAHRHNNNGRPRWKLDDIFAVLFVVRDALGACHRLQRNTEPRPRGK